MSRPLLALRLLIPIAFLTPASANAGAMFMGLGEFSLPRAVNADGSVVAGRDGGGGVFRWTASTGLVSIGSFGELPAPAGISADGSVIVGQYSDLEIGVRPFRWTTDGGFVDIGVLPGSFQGVATDVSADGSMVVGFSDLVGFEAFLWTDGGGMVGLGHVAGCGASFALGISADGSVIVGNCNDVAVRWVDGSISPFGFGGSVPASAISADGSVIVGSTQSAEGQEASRWTEQDGTMGLGDLPGGEFLSRAEGVSGDGSVIIGFGTPDPDTNGGAAFIWDDANGIRQLEDVLVNDLGLDLAGWTLQRARAISDDGLTIVGEGVNPSGVQEGWIAIVPEPSTALLLGSGLVAMAVGRRPRRRCH